MRRKKRLNNQKTWWVLDKKGLNVWISHLNQTSHFLSGITLLILKSQNTVDKSHLLNSQITVKVTLNLYTSGSSMKDCRWCNTNRPLIYPWDKRTYSTNVNMRSRFSKLLFKKLRFILRISYHKYLIHKSSKTHLHCQKKHFL